MGSFGLWDYGDDLHLVVLFFHFLGDNLGLQGILEDFFEGFAGFVSLPNQALDLMSYGAILPAFRMC